MCCDGAIVHVSNRVKSQLMSTSRIQGCLRGAGYIIGLGDRHSHNILIDQRSADVVHIDLGIAFEQGRFLTTPEMVPFRLTRDIVDGFGIAGARASCRLCLCATISSVSPGDWSLLIAQQCALRLPNVKWQTFAPESWCAGVEGVMRRCCEVTMRVLRENREALLILIEVRISVRTPFGLACSRATHSRAACNARKQHSKFALLQSVQCKFTVC